MIVQLDSRSLMTFLSKGSSRSPLGVQHQTESTEIPWKGVMRHRPSLCYQHTLGHWRKPCFHPTCYIDKHQGAVQGIKVAGILNKQPHLQTPDRLAQREWLLLQCFPKAKFSSPSPDLPVLQPLEKEKLVSRVQLCLASLAFSPVTPFQRKTLDETRGSSKNTATLTARVEHPAL